MGAFVGIALSTAGAILQTITKNDLADTGIIGINAGAAVAAVLFITYSTGAYYSELRTTFNICTAIYGNSRSISYSYCNLYDVNNMKE